MNAEQQEIIRMYRRMMQQGVWLAERSAKLVRFVWFVSGFASGVITLGLLHLILRSL